MTNELFEEVREVIKIYFKSIKTADFKLMRSVAHPDGRIFLGSTTTSRNLHDHWKDEEVQFANKERAKQLKEMEVKLITIQVEGTIAFAKIQMGNWLDYHNLVKTPEGWKFVDKVSHRIK